MPAANVSTLFLLADHLKLSLLERQRAITLDLEANAQDGQISRSLESLRTGIESLEAEAEQGDEPQTDIRDQINRLQSQYKDLSAQFQGFETPNPSSTITQPNNPSLSSDFSAAQAKPASASHASSLKRPAANGPSKSVRFTDGDARDSLFPYRDDPSDEGAPDQTELTNEQIHAYHSSVLREQDEQLDRLGESIGRQRELSMQIGDELDGQVELLDEVDEHVDRHQGQLNRARTRLGRFARKAKENTSMTIIIVLIVILVFLIAVLK